MLKRLKIVFIVLAVTIITGSSWFLLTLKPLGYGSEATDTMSQLRTLYTGLIIYSNQNNDKFPDDLQTLVNSGLLEEEDLKLHEVTLHYVKGLSPDDNNKIILYTSSFPNEPHRDHAVYIQVDFTTNRLKVSELKKRIAKEAQKEI